MYCKKQKGKNDLKIGGIYSVDDKYLIIPITMFLKNIKRKYQVMS